ncbi:hypothetical protein RDABS01_037566 [Bienertia sinuspersici]
MGRAPCCDKDGLKKGPWLPEEDQKLIDYIEKHGPGNWRTLPKKAGLERCGKSCRLRWTNYLRPDIKRGRFSFEEEEAIIQLHSVLGNKWSAIAAKLPGRTDNEIKNYWNTHIRKRLLRMGIDPVTHTRCLDYLDLPSIFTHSSSSFLQNSSDHQQQQLNLLKLLGLQSLVNPNLLNLASLLSTNQNHNFLQNFHQDDQLMMQNQLINDSIIQSTMAAPPQEAAIFDEMKSTNGFNQQCQQYTAFNDGPPLMVNNHQWQNSNNNNMVGAGVNQDSGNYQAMMDSLLETLGLNNEEHDDDLRMPPLLSTTPPLTTSNSAYQPNSSSTTTTSSEDHEIDSYCQNLMNFDIPIDLFVDNV